MDKITITKVGDKPKKVHVKHSPSHKTQKSVKGILKVKGVSDPARPPPMKRKHTMKIMTDRSVRKNRKTLRRRISKLKDSELTSIIEKSKLNLNPQTPRGIKDKIVENAVSAGFLSLE
jgi:hypothetical protein